MEIRNVLFTQFICTSGRMAFPQHFLFFPSTQLRISSSPRDVTPEQISLHACHIGDSRGVLAWMSLRIEFAVDGAWCPVSNVTCNSRTLASAHLPGKMGNVAIIKCKSISTSAASKWHCENRARISSTQNDSHLLGPKVEQHCSSDFLSASRDESQCVKESARKLARFDEHPFCHFPSLIDFY
ncbi:hypothetical protein XU18_2897 [Perkinsela sp. CCAP 1560/4]|nr:hypothetical protein XU18_2897 [Perkinsela sp. CCAP 1560/4]|eukprot:KNH06392.1 hypothetical protein XU18_2897 [Perkinsela sp. CCAP 1560/4]